MRLRALRIVEPCHEEWQSMRGDERARHCERCELQVVNLSELTRAEAEEVLQRRAPRCVERA